MLKYLRLGLNLHSLLFVVILIYNKYNKIFTKTQNQIKCFNTFRYSLWAPPNPTKLPTYLRDRTVLSVNPGKEIGFLNPKIISWPLKLAERVSWPYFYPLKNSWPISMPLPPLKIATRIIATWIIATQGNCHPLISFCYHLNFQSISKFDISKSIVIIMRGHPIITSRMG